MKTNIGLSVCYDTKNFGSQLQVLATDKKIRSLGYSTEIIRYKKKLSFRFALQTIPRFLNPYFVRSKMRGREKRKKISIYPEIKKNIEIRNKRFEQFVDVYFDNLSESYEGWEQLKEKTAENYNGFLCGSDQLWLPSNLGSHFYTLEFAPDNKTKIAYATSFGVSQIPWFQKRRTANYLNRFSSLSSRELKGTDIIRELTGRDVVTVCDPTLLLTAEEWYEIIPNKRVLEEKYIFCYFLGKNQEHREIANQLKAQTGLKIITIPFLDEFVESDLEFGDLSIFDIDAADFVSLIRNAEYVLTDSFHGSVFSILNHKKFIILNRFSEGSKNSRNSRIDSLCSVLGVSERRYAGNISKIYDEIDYKTVDENLYAFRNHSIDYLKEALEQV